MYSSNGQPPRVVITGIGAVTPLGLTMDETWDALLAGRSGIDTVTRFDTSELNTRFAGELKGFEAKNYMDRKEARRLDPYIQYALVAAEQAFNDSGLDPSKETPTDIGVLIASGTGGVTSLLDNFRLTEKRGLRKVSPFLIPNMLVDSAAGKIAILYNLRGPASLLGSVPIPKWTMRSGRACWLGCETPAYTPPRDRPHRLHRHG